MPLEEICSSIFKKNRLFISVGSICSLLVLHVACGGVRVQINVAEKLFLMRIDFNPSENSILPA